MDCSLPGSSIHGIVLGQNTGVGYHFLLQRIFPIHKSNLCLLCLLHCRQILYPLSHQRSPQILSDGAYILYLCGCTLCSPMDYSLPASSVHRIFQARIQGWTAVFFKESSQLRDQTCCFCVSCTGWQVLYHRATWEAQMNSEFGATQFNPIRTQIACSS